MKGLDRLILGSGSASRRDILKEMGLEFDIVKAEIDEKATRDPDPAVMVKKIAHAKADAILEKLRRSEQAVQEGETVLLLTGDQVVVHMGTVLEKPESPDEARLFIDGYNRGPAQTVGSVVITNVRSGRRYDAVDVAEIYFREIPKEVVEKLIEEGDVFYCAGGLKVEDPLVSVYVDHIIGSMDAVMGLSKQTVDALLQRAIEDAAKD